MRMRRTNPLMEILRPLGQLLLFVLIGAAAMSAIVILLALILRSTRDDMDLVQITRQPEAKVLDEFGNENPLVPSHARHERRSPPSA